MHLGKICEAWLKHLQILLEQSHLILPVTQFKEEPLSIVFYVRGLALGPNELIEVLQTVLSYRLYVRFNNFLWFVVCEELTEYLPYGGLLILRGFEALQVSREHLGIFGVDSMSRVFQYSRVHGRYQFGNLLRVELRPSSGTVHHDFLRVQARINLPGQSQVLIIDNSNAI